MNLFKVLAAAAVVAAVAFPAMAGDSGRNFQVKNRLRFEYDDNVNETEKDTKDSFKILEEIEFLVNMNFAQSFVGLRYRPTFVWWEDRDPDDTDIHQDLDLLLTHNFTPRLSLSVKDTMRFAEQPQEIDRGTTVRERDDYKYNVADGILTYLLQPSTRLELGSRYTLLRYDRDETADLEDYDIVAGGVTVRHELNPNTAVAGEFRYETIEYDGPERGSDSEFLGAGIEQIFSPTLLGNLRAGAQMKQFEDDDIDDETAPYFDGSLTYLPSPKTRITTGVGYSMFESDIFPYASQDRTLVYVSAAHDLTARLSIYLAASYQLSDYAADQSIDADYDDGEPVEDGEETVAQFSARTSYKLNRNNAIELGWQFLTVDADVPTTEDYDRNRIELGWRTQI